MGSGLAGFECALDGGGFTACSSPKTHTGLGSGSHTFQVRSLDVAGNVDATPASFIWVVDVTGPAAPTIGPSPASVVSTTGASFGWTNAEGGGANQCRLDGGAYAACATPANYTGLAEGSHTFDVRQVDAATNQGAAASFTWTIDTTAPTTNLTATPTDPSNSSSPSFSFGGADGGSGVASFACEIDGGGYSSCTSAKSYAGLAAGSHTFNVRAVDGAGNADASPASVTWTIDLTAPSAPSISVSPASPSGSAAASFGFSGEAGATFACRIDGGSYLACADPRAIRPLRRLPYLRRPANGCRRKHRRRCDRHLERGHDQADDSDHGQPGRSDVEHRGVIRLQRQRPGRKRSRRFRV